MNLQFKQLSTRFFNLFLAIGLFAAAATAQQQPNNGAIRGRVTDAAQAVIVGADVTIIGTDGAARKLQTDRAGEFAVTLAPGIYIVRVADSGFALYEHTAVTVTPARAVALDITLEVMIQETQVTVGEQTPINTNPDPDASAIVLKGRDLKALPDNRSDLKDALQALVGPGAGPDGGEVFIDGFSGGKLPRRDAIKEIRINQNPFSSEFDRFGLGRVEIITKPGAENWTGEIGGEFEDSSFNSRNSFAANRPPFQLRNVSGSFAGPLIKKRLSFFTDFERENVDNNALINALVLNPNLTAAPLQFQQAVVAPLSNLDFTGRFDWQLNEKNTLTASYGYEGSKSKNAGLGGFDLPTRAFTSNDSEQSLRLIETWAISPAIVNEIRFQYLRQRDSQIAANNSPTVEVLDALTTGGANVGQSFDHTDRFELQNYTSFSRGRHTLKIGGRIRRIGVTDASPDNFAGTFTFTSLDQYRNTILRTAGASPSQFSIAAGNPQASVKRTDSGIFAQDDWRVNQTLTLSFGLRYETQTNIAGRFDFAPRLAFAYSPGANGGNRAKTVFRGGFGVFYTRFGENLTLQAVRFNGVNQQQFVVTDPAILNQIAFTTKGVSNIPTIQSLTAFAQPQTTRVVAANLQTPRTVQSVLSVERQLPFSTTLSASFVNTRTDRLLRSRNLTAPRANTSAGNIFQYESTGRFNQNQLILNLRSNFDRRVSIFANYSFGTARSDTDGAGTFPADSFDLSNEYGNAALDIRHRVVVGGNISPPLFGIRFSPFVTFRTGVPYNITTGADNNGDTLFTDRPTFGQLAARCAQLGLTANFCDASGLDLNQIIKRNYGRGPEFFAVNLRTAKEFSFGGGKKNAAKSAQTGGDTNNRTGTNSPFGGGGQGGDDDDDDGPPYKLELSLQVRNLFNRTNGGTPVGNLGSPFFGEPVAPAGNFGGGGNGQSGGNRRLRFEVQFSF